MKLLPDLHRISDRKPDWERIPQSMWTPIQRRAAETHGIDTPGNRETLKGLLLCIGGLACIAKEHYVAGTVLSGFGRLSDLKDGKIADATGTKGPVGEAFDAIADNVLVAAAIPISLSKDLVSDEEGAAMGGVITLKFLGSAVAKRRGREIHASRIAKIGQMLQWVGMGARLIDKIGENYDLPRVRHIAGPASDTLLRTAITASAIGSTAYLKTAFAPNASATV